MSLKVTVYLASYMDLHESIDPVRKENKLFLKRPIRKLPNGQPVIVYRGKVHSLYQGNVILLSPDSAAKEEATVVDEEEALILLANLKPLEYPMNEESDNLEQRNWEEQEGIHRLEFKKDWNLDLREYYSYIVFKEDKEFASDARDILTNPSQYLVVEKGMIAGETKFEDGRRTEIIYPYSGKNSSHLSFEDRYGDLDFEFRESFQKASDGVQYDYWFRFDPNTDKELLKELAQELFDMSSISKVNDLYHYFSIENYTLEIAEVNDFGAKNKEANEFEANRNQEIVKENKSLVQQITRLEEQLESSQDDTFLEDLVEKEDEVEGLLVSVDNLEKENEHLKEELAKSRLTEKLIKSKLDDESRELLKLCFPNVYFLEKRTLRSLRKDYSSKEAVVREAQSILTATGNSRRVRGTTHWLEVTKKISNGTDNQGRLYFCKLSDNQVSHAMLISHKSQQDVDIDYLKKHDPPRLDEI